MYLFYFYTNMKYQILFFLFFLFITNLNGQRFSAGIVGGLNATVSEVLGSENSTGLNLGLVGTAKLANRFYLSTEILWSQNGEYIQPLQYADIQYDRVRLDFVEIPIQLAYLMKPKEEDRFQKGWLRIGIAYTKLIDYKIEVGLVERNELVVWDKKEALLINFGGVYFFNEHWGINCRMSLSTFGKDMGPTIAFRGMYVF